MRRELTKLVLTCGAVVALGSLTQCGSDSGGSDDSGGGGGTSATVTFAQVNAILTDHCGNSTCHGSGTAQFEYVDNETNLTTRATSVLARVNTQKDMPPSADTDANVTTAQLAITDDERQMIKDFLQQ